MKAGEAGGRGSGKENGGKFRKTKRFSMAMAVSANGEKSKDHKSQ